MSNPDVVPMIDPSVIASLRELDDDGGSSLLIEVIDLYVNEASAQVAALQSALQSGDLRALERTAHTLKSSSANVGALGFAALCADIEHHGRAANATDLDELVGRAQQQYVEVCKALAAVKG